MAIGSINRLLRRSTFVVKSVRSTRTIWYKWAGVRNNKVVVDQLSVYSPNSSGTLQALAGLALQSAQQIFPLLSSLIEVTSRPLIIPEPIEALFRTQIAGNDPAELAELFNRYGSDKSSVHNYHLLYAPLLAPRRIDRLRLLEIGIGSNNPDVVSTMGVAGRPGASLRAFRDFLPNAQIFGADIDRRVLFEEDRIRTYCVDQTKVESFEELSLTLGSELFDVVVDDGLHSPNANIATMLFALKVLRPSGYFIVEDISLVSLPVWQVVAALLPESYRPTLIRTRNCFLFLIQKPS
jgi:hypothetical protein